MTMVKRSPEAPAEGSIVLARGRSDRFRDIAVLFECYTEDDTL